MPTLISLAFDGGWKQLSNISFHTGLLIFVAAAQLGVLIKIASTLDDIHATQIATVSR